MPLTEAKPRFALWDDNEESSSSDPWWSSAADTASDWAGSAADTASDWAGDAVDTASGVASGVADVASGVVDRATDVASGVVDSASDLASGAVDRATDVASGVVDGVSGLASGVVDRATEVASGVVDRVSGVAGRVADAAGGAAGRLVDRGRRGAGRIADTAEGLGEGVLDLAGEAVERFQRGATRIVTGIRDVANLDAVQEAIRDLGRPATLDESSMASIVSGLEAFVEGFDPLEVAASFTAGQSTVTTTNAGNSYPDLLKVRGTTDGEIAREVRAWGHESGQMWRSPSAEEFYNASGQPAGPNDLVAGANFAYSLHIGLPELVNRSQCSAEVQATFDAWVAGILRHEIGHRNLEATHLQNLRTGIVGKKLPVAKARFEAVIAALDAAQTEFDGRDHPPAL